jgi:hypothetical protein
MKKVVLGVMLLFLAFSLISLASAVEINLSKEVYATGETLQAEIYGNFLENIKIENIHFYRERNIPVEYDLLKLRDKYLLYALLPYTEGNYTLAIEDIRYEEDNIITDSEIVKGFQIIKGNGTYIAIDPGFVVARQDFYIKVEAQDNIDIQVDFLNQTQTSSLLEGKPKNIYFSIQGVNNYTEASISILGYNIPVFIFPNKSEEISETSKFRFNPLSINTAILKDEGTYFTVSLVNFGIKNITNINLTSNFSDLAVLVTPSYFEKLGAQSREFMNISISSEKVGNFSGKIIAESENLTTELDVFIRVTENRSEIIIDKNKSIGYTKNDTCEKGYNGKICGAGEICNTVVFQSEDGYCCTGECKKVEEKSDSSWIYGVILIIVLVGGIVGFSVYIKKKQGKPVNLLKKREDEFKERMNPPSLPPSTEVSGNLSKI